MDKKGIPREGRTFTLSIKEYKEQYDAGIDRVAGLNIIWVT